MGCQHTSSDSSMSLMSKARFLNNLTKLLSSAKFVILKLTFSVRGSFAVMYEINYIVLSSVVLRLFGKLDSILDLS